MLCDKILKGFSFKIDGYSKYWLLIFPTKKPLRDGARAFLLEKTGGILRGQSFQKSLHFY